MVLMCNMSSHESVKAHSIVQLCDYKFEMEVSYVLHSDKYHMQHLYPMLKKEIDDVKQLNSYRKGVPI